MEYHLRTDNITERTGEHARYFSSGINDYNCSLINVSNFLKQTTQFKFDSLECARYENLKNSEFHYMAPGGSSAIS